MPMPVEFHKDYAEYLLDCLRYGEPIAPRCDEWRQRDQLILAAAACFVLVSHGPVLEQPDLTPEQKAANDSDFTDELLATIGFVSTVMMAVESGEYDERFEAIMKCGVYGRPSAIKVQPLEGWR
jgi:hypothetical protein